MGIVCAPSFPHHHHLKHCTEVRPTQRLRTFGLNLPILAVSELLPLGTCVLHRAPPIRSLAQPLNSSIYLLRQVRRHINFCGVFNIHLGPYLYLCRRLGPSGFQSSSPCHLEAKSSGPMVVYARARLGSFCCVVRLHMRVEDRYICIWLSCITLLLLYRAQISILVQLDDHQWRIQLLDSQKTHSIIGITCNNLQ